MCNLMLKVMLVNPMSKAEDTRHVSISNPPVQHRNTFFNTPAMALTAENVGVIGPPKAQLALALAIVKQKPPGGGVKGKC